MGDTEIAGFRFQLGSAIPVNAHIRSAYIRFRADQTATAGGWKLIYTQNADASATFGTTTNNLSSRTRSTNAVAWKPGAWTSGQQDAGTTTPNLASIVQQVVDRASWDRQSITFLVIPPTNKKNVHRVKGFDGTTAFRPQLTIEWTTSINADVLVVGAGMSGLTAALEAQRQGLNAWILEAGTRPGGRMKTDYASGEPLDLGATWFNSADDMAKEDEYVNDNEDNNYWFYKYGKNHIVDTAKNQCGMTLHKVYETNFGATQTRILDSSGNIHTGLTNDDAAFWTGYLPRAGAGEPMNTTNLWNNMYNNAEVLWENWETGPSPITFMYRTMKDSFSQDLYSGVKPSWTDITDWVSRTVYWRGIAAENSAKYKLLTNLMESEVAVSFDKIGTMAMWEGAGYYGDDMAGEEGMSFLAHCMADIVPIRYNAKVTVIDHGGNWSGNVTAITGSATQNFVTQGVISTTSVGTLQNNAISFVPALDNSTQVARDRLVMGDVGGTKSGTLSKVIVRWYNNRWWKTRSPWYVNASTPSLNTTAVYMEGTATDSSYRNFNHLFDVNDLSWDADYLVFFNAGKEGHDQEQTHALLAESDPQHPKNQVMSRLGTIFNKNGYTVPAPDYYVMTDWASDPLFRGSYSAVGPNARTHFEDNATRRMMLKTQSTGRLILAGEGSSETMAGSLLGAYSTGDYAADKMAASFNGEAMNLTQNPGVTVSQSSTDFGGVASRAIDENTSGVWAHDSITHTTTEANPWWEVNLGGDYNVTSVALYDRTDSCCTDHLKNVWVELLDSAATPNVIAARYLTSVADLASVGVAGTGVRKVRIRLVVGTGKLSLAEVKVWGFKSRGSLGNTLSTTDRLYQGESLTSNNGVYKAAVQTNGRLQIRVISTNALVWQSHTADTRANSLHMRADGNLVLHSKNAGVVWSTQTNPNTNCYARLLDTGSLVVRNGSGTTLWSTPAP